MERPNLRLAPEFIEPLNILEMSVEDQEAMLNRIRENRMVAVATYLQAKAEKDAVKEEKLSLKMEKIAGYIVKEVAKLDATFERLEERINQLRAVRLEAGL